MSALSSQLKRRCDAAARSVLLDSGCRDPLVCSRAQQTTAGYEDAACHLLDHGLTPAPNLPAMRSMWTENKDSRHIAQTIAKRWEMAA
jgi:hypothetical protein